MGKTSLEDCEALTWSLGWTAPFLPSFSDARVARTSLVFMFDEVPEPVWNTSIGKFSSHFPSATSSAAAAMASAMRLVDVGDLVEAGVDLGRLALDHRQGPDQAAVDGQAGDREVLHRPLGLRGVLGAEGDPHLAHGVVLDAEPTVGLRHGADATHDPYRAVQPPSTAMVWPVT